MSKIRKPKPVTINLNQLAELAKQHPKYTKFLLGLTTIDGTLKAFVKEIVTSCTDDDTDFYIKTELMAQCYSLYLYRASRQVTIGVSWPLIDLLEKCSNKTIEADLNMKVRQMILKFDESGLSVGDRINWIY